MVEFGGVYDALAMNLITAIGMTPRASRSGHLKRLLHADSVTGDML